MPRYIDAEMLKEYVWGRSSHMLCKWDAAGVVDAIDIQETADVAPVRRGSWKPEGDCGITRCSVCRWSIEECIDWNYCPNCGAKMDGKRGANHDA